MSTLSKFRLWKVTHYVICTGDIRLVQSVFPVFTSSKPTKTKPKLRALSPRANYTHHATAAYRRSFANLRIEGVEW
jgi:hypothetical protein